MKLKNVEVGEQYIIKSLSHTLIGNAPFKIGDRVEVVRVIPDYPFHPIEVNGGWWIHHKDLKRIRAEVQDLTPTVDNVYGGRVLEGVK